MSLSKVFCACVETYAKRPPTSKSEQSVSLMGHFSFLSMFVYLKYDADTRPKRGSSCSIAKKNPSPFKSISVVELSVVSMVKKGSESSNNC